MPEEQRILAIAALFTLMCKVYDQSPVSLYEKASRMMSDTERGWTPEWRAMRTWLLNQSGDIQHLRASRKQEQFLSQL